MKKLMIVDDSNIIRSRIARVIGSPRVSSGTELVVMSSSIVPLARRV